jgi:hypothetical protein
MRVGRPLSKPRDATVVRVMEDPVAAAAAAGAAIDAAHAVFDGQKAGQAVEAAAEAYTQVTAGAEVAGAAVSEASAVLADALGGGGGAEAAAAAGEAASAAMGAVEAAAAAAAAAEAAAALDVASTAAVASAAVGGTADAAATAAGLVAGKAVAATGAAIVVKQIATASLAKDMWATYSGLLSVYPLATKSITGSFLYSLSDGIAQKATILKESSSTDEGDDENGAAMNDSKNDTTTINDSNPSSVDESDKIDRGRVARFAAWGPIDASMTTVWYLVLDGWTERFFPTETLTETIDETIQLTTNWPKVAFEVFVDQTVYCPLWFLVFFSFTGAWERRPVAETFKRIKTEMVPAVTTSWWIWVPLMTISFGYVPSELRVPYYLVASFGYAMLLSAMWGDAGPEQALDEDAK